MFCSLYALHINQQGKKSSKLLVTPERGHYDKQGQNKRPGPVHFYIFCYLIILCVQKYIRAHVQPIVTLDSIYDKARDPFISSIAGIDTIYNSSYQHYWQKHCKSINMVWFFRMESVEFSCSFTNYQFLFQRRAL